MEETIDQRLPYRVGFSYPLLPLPLYTTTAEPAHDDRPLQDTVLQILKEYEIKSYYIRCPLSFKYRHIEEEFMKRDLQPTALVECIYEGPKSAERWVAAARRIRHYLLHKHDPPITCKLELVDLVFEDSRKVVPIPPSDQISRRWNSGLRQRVLATIQGRQWKRVDIFYLTRQLYVDDGDNKELQELMVIIEASDVKEPAWWDEVLPQIRSFLPPGVGVELRRWREWWYDRWSH
jgi:hypothetical protein